MTRHVIDRRSSCGMPRTGVEISRLRGPARVYSSPTFGPDGRTLAALATADENTTVVVWDVITGIERFSTTPLPDGAFSVTFHPDGRSFFVPDFGGIRRYSADDGREIESLSTPGFQPDRVVPDPMGARIAISSQLSRAVQVRDLATENPPLTIPVGDVTSIDWSPNGERLAIGSGNQGPIRVVDVSSGEDAMILRGHIGGAADVAFVSDERLASVGSDELRVWNVSDAGPADLGAVASELGRTHSVVEFSPDGSEMAVIVRNNGDMLQFFSTRGRQPLRSPLTDRLEFSGIIISPDWRILASVAADGRGVVQDLGSLAELQELPECAGPSAFSPDGSLLVLDGKSLCTPTEGGTLTASPGTNLRSRVVDTATGELVLDLKERVILSSQFNPAGRFEAGRYLAVALDDDVDVVEIYDVATHELVADLGTPHERRSHIRPERTVAVWWDMGRQRVGARPGGCHRRHIARTGDRVRTEHIEGRHTSCSFRRRHPGHFGKWRRAHATLGRHDGRAGARVQDRPNRWSQHRQRVDGLQSGWQLSGLRRRRRRPPAVPHGHRPVDRTRRGTTNQGDSPVGVPDLSRFDRVRGPRSMNRRPRPEYRLIALAAGP